MNNHKVMDKRKCEFELCKICRLNHNQGQRHKYFPRHKTSILTLLTRFQSKIGEVRESMKNPSIVEAQSTSVNGFWCIFCDSQVREVGSSLACEKAINHLASANHFKNLKHFVWKYGDGGLGLDNLRIVEADLIKWEKKCKSLKSEDAVSKRAQGHLNNIHNELIFGNLNSLEKSTLKPFISSNSNTVMPLQYNTNEYQVSASGNPEVRKVGLDLHDDAFYWASETFSGTVSWNSNQLIGKGCVQQLPLHFNRISSSGGYQMNGGLHSDDSGTTSKIFGQGLRNVTQVSSSVNGDVEGNVHSGAPPPWLEATDEVAASSTSTTAIGSSKSRKLNPKRVGAAWAEKRQMEMEKEKAGETIHSDYDSNWLPSFGRVWQSGSRKESRKEFESEKLKLTKVENECEMPIKMQPYISKRMRGDIDE